MYYNGIVAIEFWRGGANSNTARLGIFPGSFNPPTRAHLLLAEMALSRVDEVLFVLPRSFPHKQFDAITFEHRRDMIVRAAEHEPRFSVASAGSGLFIDIARECRGVYPAADLTLLCGRDVAERIVNWDYGHPGAFREMLDEFEVLVASRNGHYEPPADMRHRMGAIELPCDDISATEVRERIRNRQEWKDLVPESIAQRVGELYGDRRGGTL